MNRTSTVPADPETQSASPAGGSSTTTEKASLKSFMGMAGTQKCDFADPETGNSGTVYLDSGKMRGDFSSNINGKVTPSHMTHDGKDVYVWMDDQATGFKTSLEAIEQMSGQTGVSQSVDINKEVDYKCESWAVDPVKFVVPSEIKFQDMGKMMEEAMKRMPSTSLNGSANDNAAACSACNNLEGDAQTQCKKALKCN